MKSEMIIMITIRKIMRKLKRGKSLKTKIPMSVEAPRRFGIRFPYFFFFGSVEILESHEVSVTPGRLYLPWF